MNIETACEIIESIISEKNKNGDNWYSLQLSSQPNEQEDGTFKEIYRADCMYMVSGTFKNTITEALIDLAKKLKDTKQ
jgi:hypothetical protein